MDYRINPDISAAETLPGSFYSDADAYHRMKESVFAPSWQFIGHHDLCRVPNQVFPLTLLESFLDEPLLLTRDADDTLRCLSNVCTHRGFLVSETPGVCKTLRCRYHGRTFGLDGCMKNMPEFEQAKDFPREEDNLRSISLGSVGELLFANLNADNSLADSFAPMLDRVSFLPIAEAKLDQTRSRDYLVDCHWALYCENYLEGFHIPYVHKGLNDAIEYDSYGCELFPGGSLQIGYSKGGDDVFGIPESSPDFGKQVSAYYYFLFPNLMFNFYPWGLSLNVVKPISISRTRVSFLAFVWDESKLDSGAGAELDRVEREDEAIVEQVQRGVASRNYRAGRFSPTREQAVHHFQRELTQALSRD